MPAYQAGVNPLLLGDGDSSTKGVGMGAASPAAKARPLGNLRWSNGESWRQRALTDISELRTFAGLASAFHEAGVWGGPMRQGAL